MKKFFSIFFLPIFCLIVLAALLLTACGTNAIPASASGGYTDIHKIPHPTGINLEGAAGVDRESDVQNSRYYPSLDFYNMKSGGSLTIIENFKTIQQISEVTCGPACVIMLLEYYGMYNGQSDWDLYELREDKERPETLFKDMFALIKSTGDWDIYSTYDLDDPDVMPEDLIINSLKDGKPIIFGDGEWGVGHWRIIIGYDDMGDDTVANDVLILAEPYDTNDHNQDGYTIMPFERLYYNWANPFDTEFSQNLFIIASPKR